MQVFLHAPGGATYTSRRFEPQLSPTSRYIGIAKIARQPVFRPALLRLWLFFAAIVAAATLLAGGWAAPLVRHEGALELAVTEGLALAVTLVIALAAAALLATPEASRSSWLAPLPALACWLCASAFACLQRMDRIGMNGWGAAGSTPCLLFLLGVGLVLSAATLWTLRGGPLDAAGGAMAGLAGAAGAGSILSLHHPWPLDLVDLSEHWTAMVTVIVAAALIGRLLSPGNRAR